MKPFTSEQEYFITQGDKLSDELTLRALQALGVNKSPNETKRHAYIFSPPGAGKTFTVQAVADKHKIKPIKIQGVSSLNAFVTHMAVAVYLRPTGDIIVWVDDCDSLFMEADGLNLMKGAMDEERNELSWGKNLTAQIMSYEKSSQPNDLIRAAALRSFQPEGGVGVVIPTDRVRFIVTSNKKLTKPTDPKAMTNAKKMHESAICDRVAYKEFDISDKESWGWIASVLMKNNILGLKKEQKQILLDFMWNSWSKLPSGSMRAVKEYASWMLDHPKDYPDRWNLTLTRSA